MKRTRGLMLALPLALAGLTAPALAQEATLRVGTARIDVTPPADARFPSPGGYDHEHLHVRAIVLDNGTDKALMIGGDLSGTDEAVWQEASTRITAELGIPAAHMLISPTHTHSDWPARPEGAARYGTDFVAGAMVDAVKQALAGLEPATMGYNKGEAHLNVNRDTIDATTRLWTQAANLDAPVDTDVDVLWFARPDGSPIAAHVTYAMHPVAGYLAGFTSADFPGAMSRHVEKAFDEKAVVIFAQGASGDANPRWLRTGTNALAARSGQPVTGFEMNREAVEAPIRGGLAVGVTPAEEAKELADYMQALGIILGEEAIRVMSTTDAMQAAPRIWGKTADVTCPGRKRLDNVREGSPGQYEDGDDVTLRLTMIGLGDVALTTANAEIYGPIGKRVKAESPMGQTIFVGLGNGRTNSGYVPDDEAFGHYTFQVLGSRLKPGCAEEGIVNGIKGLAADYLADSTAK